MKTYKKYFLIITLLCITLLVGCKIDYKSGPDIDAPSINQPSGTTVNNAVIPVTVTCPPGYENSLIYYTTDIFDDTKDPRISTDVKTATHLQVINITRSVYFKAYIKKPGFNNSPIIEATYIVTGTTPDPIATTVPASGTYNNDINITVDKDPSIPHTAFIYTLDGGVNYTTDYSDTINIPITYNYVGSQTDFSIYVRRVEYIDPASWDNSANTITRTYTLECEQPVIPAPATSDGGATYDFTINPGVTAGASIYYTTDGSVPSDSSTLYTGPFNVPSGTTVKAVSHRGGYQDSAVVTQTAP